MFENWLLHTDNRVTTLTLNRPQAMNTLTPEALYELRAIATQLNEDEETWVVVLEGAGEHFSAGVDVHAIGQIIDQSPEDFRRELAGLQACLDAFDALKKPTIACLRGYCIGGGLLLALCCDFRIADTTTRFYLPEVRLGIAVIMGTHRITRAVGQAAAREMILLAEPLDGAQAYRYGLITALAEPDALSATVASYADKFRRLPPHAVAIARQIIVACDQSSPVETQALEIDLQAAWLAHPDLKEGIAAFFEKRPPHFTGL